MNLRLLYGGLALVAASLPSPALACASCGCTLTSDWLSQGLASQPGTTFLLRYDYVPQTVLRSGTHRVDRASINLPADREIELSTFNHSVTAQLDHQFANDFGLNVQLPFIVRPHRTIAEDTIDPSGSRTNGFGDLRVVGRWAGLSTKGSITGLEAGLVLPTGKFHQRFRSGPAAGDEVDRGLQPGRGTVQAVLGAYHFGRLGPVINYLVQVSGQTALGYRDGYKPGSFVQASTALVYAGWRGITPQLQLNARVTGRDKGSSSDRPNSGGEQVNVAPGIAVDLSPRLSAFTFVELPLFTRVNGYQLVPKAKLSAGIQLRL